MKKKPQTISRELRLPDTLPGDYVPTPDAGLTDDEAARRAQAGQTNKAQDDPGKSPAQILIGQLFTLFNLLNVALAVVLFLVGSYRNMLFMGVVVSNTFIGTFQELRAHNTIKKLKLLNQPVVTVLRGGTKKQLKSEELVKGDLIILKAGDQIPADAIVRSGSGSVNESLLTGESDPVAKTEGAWLMSGSYVTEGSFHAQLVYVGADSYISRLTAEAKRIKPQQTQLTADINRIIRFVSIALVPIGAALFCKQYFIMNQPLNTSVTSTVAAMIGMIPEGLLLLTSVALAVGVVKLGRHQTLVQELHGIETLARVDVLCLDKTGTLTTGEMSLKELMPVDADQAEAEAAMRRFLGAFEEGNSSFAALEKAFGKGNEAAETVVPFSSARKRSAVQFRDGQALILGAANFVLSDSDLARVSDKISAAAEAGSRVMVFVSADSLPADGEKCTGARILGLVLLQDTLRDSCAETLAYFKEQGVDIRIISGDDPRTVAAVARRAGVEGAGNYVDASTLKTEADIAEAVKTVKVFGRVTPQQKHALVNALKAQGHSVAMTGDGVNDIPAMKAADCSIAMAGGSDAAKHAAQLTLLNADFACMPLIVAEGRRVVNNITRAASLFLVKTLYSFLLGVLLILVPAGYPFQPIQLTLISSMTIGFPTFVLALQPNSDRIKGNFLRKVITNAAPASISVALAAIFCMLLEKSGVSREACSTMAAASAGAVGLLALLRVCLPFNRLRAALFAVCTIGLAGAMLLFGHVFMLTALTGEQYALLAGVIAVTLGVCLVLYRLSKKYIKD